MTHVGDHSWWWRSCCRRYPHLSYELITPNRRPLPASGLVHQLPELLPSAVLNFRVLDGLPQHAGRVPLLSDQLLATTQLE